MGADLFYFENSKPDMPRILCFQTLQAAAWSSSVFRERKELALEMVLKFPTPQRPSYGETSDRWDLGFVMLMANGMKARFQRLNLFNIKQEQKDVSEVNGLLGVACHAKEDS